MGIQGRGNLSCRKVALSRVDAEKLIFEACQYLEDKRIRCKSFTPLYTHNEDISLREKTKDDMGCSSWNPWFPKMVGSNGLTEKVCIINRAAHLQCR
jgi:hypothetical protein